MVTAEGRGDAAYSRRRGDHREVVRDGGIGSQRLPATTTATLLHFAECFLYGLNVGQNHEGKIGKIIPV